MPQLPARGAVRLSHRAPIPAAPRHPRGCARAPDQSRACAPGRPHTRPPTHTHTPHTRRRKKEEDAHERSRATPQPPVPKGPRAARPAAAAPRGAGCARRPAQADGARTRGRATPSRGAPGRPPGLAAEQPGGRQGREGVVGRGVLALPRPGPGTAAGGCWMLPVGRAPALRRGPRRVGPRAQRRACYLWDMVRAYVERGCSLVPPQAPPPGYVNRKTATGGWAVSHFE